MIKLKAKNIIGFFYNIFIFKRIVIVRVLKYLNTRVKMLTSILQIRISQKKLLEIIEMFLPVL